VRRGIDGSIILKRILQNADGNVWSGFNWMSVGYYDGIV
jgi:hypothetical protein